MINTLRITSVIAVLLAGVFFVFPVVFGVRSNQKVNEYVVAPGVRDTFEQAANNKDKSTENRASPLVQQAEAFSLYLNPPKPTISMNPQAPKTGGILRMTTGVSPKFKVYGTSYCPDNPGLSLVLIDEPGRGRRWVRQTDKVGHLIIEQVKDGLVIVNNGQETFELTVEQIPEPAMAKPASGFSTQMPIQSSMRSTLPVSNKTTSGVARAVRTPSGATENEAKLEELAKKLIDVQKNSQTGKSGQSLSDAEKTARTLELISQYKSARRPTRVSEKEAQELGDLGQTLEQTQAEPNVAGAPMDKDDAASSVTEPNQLLKEKTKSK